MVLDQIKCPPGNEKKQTYGLGKFVGTWLPAMESYMIDYVGLGGMTGSTTKKEARKAAIGYNKFVKLSGKCGAKSDPSCRGEDKYMYMKAYPFGYLPICTKTMTGNNKHTGNIPIAGGTGLLGGIQEDIYNLNVGDAMKSMTGKGPFASNNCMRARLPVGDGILQPGLQFSNAEEVQLNGRGWHVEEKCIPRQPTVEKKYGNETFNIPFSASRCIKEMKVTQNTNIKEKFSLFPSYNITDPNNSEYVKLVLILSILSLIGIIILK